MNRLILRTTAPLHLFLLVLFAVYLLLRGHNAPGGGFIAGLMTALAIILQAIVFDTHHARRLFPFRESSVIGVGLLIAVGTGLLGPVVGAPFLNHYFATLESGLLGKVEVATAVVFDIGVYLVVVGVAKSVILSIAEDLFHQRERRRSWNS